MAPLISFAAQPTTINEIFSGFVEGNMSGLIPACILVGLITFLAGVINYVRAGDDEESRSKGRAVMIYGVIIMFVMVSAWGFVRILYYSFFSEEMTLPNYLPNLLEAR